MKMSWDEWNDLSVEEQETRKDEKPDGPDPLAGGYYVDDKGKKRPLKNLVGEITRKATDDIRKELNAAPKPASTKRPEDVISTLQTRGEEEMIRTGRTFPIETLISMINEGAYHIASATQQAMTKANKIRKEAKKELKKTYKDFSEYEDEFDEAVDNIHPTKVTKEGLVFVFKSVLGGHVEEREAAAHKSGVESASSGKIIGPVDGKGQPQSRNTKTKLTPEQQKEQLDMGLTEDEYLASLKKRQDNAKSMGCTILPQTFAEPFRRPK